jgi:hypothetical protein
VAGLLSTPRPLPNQTAPLLAGAAVVALALPVFLAAGWDLKGWFVGGTLWAASRLLALVLTHLQGREGNLAAGGVVGLGMTFRALAVLVVVLALAATDARLALAALLVYGLAYTLELAVSLSLYFSGAARG